MGPDFATFVACLKREEVRGWSPLGTAALLLSSLVLFSLWLVAARLGGRTVLCLVFALLLHESGHYLGMVCSGYRHVRMVFIPFFGAAVTGTKHAVPAWQEATMLLLGPLPGLTLAAALASTFPTEVFARVGQGLPWPQGLLIKLAGALLIVNAPNLVPIYPLDGGRLIQLLLFAHAPRIGLAFLSVSLLALAGLGGVALVGFGSVTQTWPFFVVGLLSLVAIPFTLRRHCLAMEVRRRRNLSASLDGLTRRECRLLFWLARRYDPSEEDLGTLAKEARDLHALIVKPALTRWGTVMVAIAYTAGWAAVFHASSRMPRIHAVG